MNIRIFISLFVLITLPMAENVSAQQKLRLADNAALRYWAAFSELQDSGISSEQAKELNLILAGTAPYRDDAYKDLIERNAPALQVMARGAKLTNCDWGLDYALRHQTPVEYARKALELGRLNVLYAFHLSLTGDKDGSARTLAAGIRFSHDVANGGSLFATLIAKTLLVDHFRAIEGLVQMQGISSPQVAELRKAIAQLGPSGLDWQAAVDRELEVLSELEWAKPLAAIKKDYMAALADPSKLPILESAIADAPPELRSVMASPRKVLESQQDLAEQLERIRQTLH
jgi:hypothetical protein